MSIYEESVKHFDLWRAELIALPPPMDNADVDISVESARREMETLQLAMEVEVIRRKVEDLGFRSAASFHQLPLSNGYLAVYVARTYPANQQPSDRYVRITYNEVTAKEADSHTAIIDDYYVDLEYRCLQSYHGSARGDGSTWTIPEDSPAIIFRQGTEVAFSPGENYRPKLPRVPDNAATFQDMNMQRQEAVALVDVLQKLGEVSLDFKVPYSA
jgi:hypothetical protein